MANSDQASCGATSEGDFLATDAKGDTLLHRAAERGSVPECAAVVAKGLPVDARNLSGLSPLHLACCHGEVETARWLLDHGADIHAVTASDYEYLWLGASPGYGMERIIPARSTPMSIAWRYHKQTKWVLGKPRQLVELLEERGAKRPLSGPRLLARILLALPLIALTFIVIFWGLLHLDGSMTGWRTLAAKYPASNPPDAVLIDSHQDGDVGTVGVIRLKSMLNAAATDEGLYLSFPGLLSAGHAPLLIPWDELRVHDEQTMLDVYILTLDAGNSGPVRITLRDGIAADVKSRRERFQQERSD